MSSQNLMRWSGVALVLAAVLIVVPTLFHPDALSPQAELNPAWGPVHIIVGVGFLFSLFGLVGLYARQAEKTGALGLIGFILAFIGNTLLVGLALFVEGFIAPVVSSGHGTTPVLHPAGLLGGPAFTASAFTVFAFSLGFLLIGLAGLRAKILPRWPNLLLIVSAPLVLFTHLVLLIGILGWVVFGMAIGWLGYTLWKGIEQGAYT